MSRALHSQYLRLLGLTALLAPKGMRVIETSADPYVALLIQAHAEVVNGFIANGHAEMMKNHPVPERPVP